MQSGTFRYPPMDGVIYGKPFAEALAAEADRLGANAVFLLAGGTLSRATDVVQQARDALGNRLAGVFTRIAAHTPRADVLAAANAARAANADLIATIGGGSVTDGAKAVRFCLANDIRSAEALDRFRPVKRPEDRKRVV
jgi:maleylacetate reductase